MRLPQAGFVSKYDQNLSASMGTGTVDNSGGGWDGSCNDHRQLEPGFSAPFLCSETL